MTVERLPSPTDDPGAGEPAAELWSRRVTEAARFMREHAREDITIPQIAAAVNVSVRALQTAFRAEVGQTPGAYLRTIRLDGVRRDLLAAAAMSERLSVGEVAKRWQFSNAGRMAAAYRAAYGVAPSSSLRYFEAPDADDSESVGPGPSPDRRRFRVVLDCEVDIGDEDALLDEVLRRSSGAPWPNYVPDGDAGSIAVFVLADAVRHATSDGIGLRLLALNPLLRLPNAHGGYEAAELPESDPVALRADARPVASYDEREASNG